MSESVVHFKRVKAELERRRCLERHEIERQQQGLEQQLELLRVKHEMDVKQAKLRQKRELLEIDKEIEQAKLKEEAEEFSSTSDKPNSTNCRNNEHRRIGEWKATELNDDARSFDKRIHLLSNKGRGTDLAGNSWQNILVDSRFDRNEEDQCYLHETSYPSKERYNTANRAKLNDQGRRDEREPLILFAETIGSSIRKGFEMPKRDCLTFDGNPMSYPRFIENFKTNIEEREQNPRVRLAYLIQFCTGTAKEAISNCVMLPEDEGYSKAREILHNSFGQNHIIIYAYINKVTKGGVIRDGEFDKLQQLARDMENCKINLTQLG